MPGDLGKHLVTGGLVNLVRYIGFNLKCSSQPQQGLRWLWIAAHFLYFDFAVVLIALARFHLGSCFV